MKARCRVLLYDQNGRSNRFRELKKQPQKASFCAQWMWIRVAGSFGRWQNRKTEWASGRYLVLVPTASTRDGRWIAFTYSTQSGQFRSRDTLKAEENFRSYLYLPGESIFRVRAT
jgi:hypothetical protein